MGKILKILIILLILYLLINNSIIEKMSQDNNIENEIKSKIDTIYKLNLKKIRSYHNSLDNIINKESDIDNLIITGNINYLPVGSIMAYNGKLIPKGWALCDGNNGTPDLRGKFIFGNGSNEQFNSAGGAESHKLTINELPAHNHSVNSHSHSHDYVDRMGVYLPPFGKCKPSFSLQGNSKNIKTEQAGNHKHEIYNTGGNQPHNNMPPYYVLKWIIKIKQY